MATEIVVAALGFLGIAYTAWIGYKSKNRDADAVKVAAETEAERLASERVQSANRYADEVRDATEKRLTEENDKLRLRVEGLEAEVRKVNERLDDASTALTQSSSRVVQLTWAMQQAGISVPDPRTY